jgi:hypothetical protein
MYAGIPATCFIAAKAKIKSFKEAVDFLDGEREKKLGSNVVARVKAGPAHRPKSVAIRLYNTDIITYHNDGTFEADNGGFNTPTTSTRCNQFGPEGFSFAHYGKKLWVYSHQTRQSLPTGKGVKIKVHG